VTFLFTRRFLPWGRTTYLVNPLNVKRNFAPPFELSLDGKPHALKPIRTFTIQERTEYDKLRYQYYRKLTTLNIALPRRNQFTARYNRRHTNARTRRRLDKRIDDNYLIETDPSIQRYFTLIKSKQKNLGYLSDKTRSHALNSARHFLLFLDKPITNTATSELIQSKRSNPQDYTLDDILEEFSNLEPIRSHRIRANYVKGIFKANRAPLQSKADCHFPTTTKPISNGILRAIYNELDQRKQDLIQYQAYAGQRIRCLALVSLEQIDMNRDAFATIHITHTQNKTRQEHDCIVPKELMQRIIERAKKLNLPCPFSNYEQLWKEITLFAQAKYQVRLTSHYLRKRFATIASDTPMDVNQWDYLMGTKKSKGHDASVYNLTFLDEKLIPNYERYLSLPLKIDSDHEHDAFEPNESDSLNELTHIIKSQQEMITRLTNQLLKTNLEGNTQGFDISSELITS
jgi:hypothetical protein